MPPFATKMAWPAAEQERTADLLNAIGSRAKNIQHLTHLFAVYALKKEKPCTFRTTMCVNYFSNCREIVGGNVRGRT